MRKKMGCFAILCLCFSFAKAQDIHFSQFFFAPQILNPAQIGSFDGTYRINANQKTQWKQVSRPYMSFALMGDGKLDITPNSVAVGAAIVNDNAGDSRFNTFKILTGGSYTIDLTAHHRLTAGLQVGLSQISINENEMSFNNQYNGVVYDPNLPSGEAFPRNSRWYFNLNAGAVYRFEIEKRKNISIGFASHNLNQPDQSFFNDTGVELSIRNAVYAFSVWKIAENFDALPAVRWMNQGTYNEVIFGSAVKHILMDEAHIYRSIFAGYFGRFGDSGIAMAGVDYDAWRVALSYDINVSDLKPASRNRGGFEFSVQYIFGEPKGKPGVRHKYCPIYL